MSVEPPAPRVALAGESLEFLDTLFRIVGTGQLLQIVADQLIEAFAKGFGLFSGDFHRLFESLASVFAAAGEEMTVSIERDMDAGVPHLVSNVCRRLAIGDQRHL